MTIIRPHHAHRWIALLAASALSTAAFAAVGCEEQAAQNNAAAAEADHDHDHDSEYDPVALISNAGDPYPLATCPVSGRDLDAEADPIVHEHEGRDIRFCCPNCVEPFEEDPEQYLQQIDEQIVEDQLPHYPDHPCPISGNELGSMGDPMDYVYQNRLVRFCCPNCDEAFEADPEEYLAELDQAVIDAQADDYPLEECVVSGEPLDAHGDPIDVVIANRLVRLCCEHCVEDMALHPARYLAAIDEGRADGGGGHNH